MDRSDRKKSYSLWPVIAMSFMAVMLATILACGRATGEGKTGPPSGSLQVLKLSDHIYQHISYLDIGAPEKVACNGMVVVDGGEAVVFDTPTDPESSLELLAWLRDSLNANIKAVIPTHFHVDCLGGLEVFHAAGIPSYAQERTLVFADSNKTVVPQNAFSDELELKVGNKAVVARYFGEGHTRDNVVGYFPEGRTLFGGCMIKSLGSGKGNLADANVEAWSATVAGIMDNYPEVQQVIPGHGDAGNIALLEYTIEMFLQQEY